MDGDTTIEPQLDAFSRAFPLPFRIASVLTLGAC